MGKNLNYWEGIASFRFDASHEILSLGDSLFTQNADYSDPTHPAYATPAIDAPPDQDEQQAQIGGLVSALQEGGHYFSVNPASDFPMVGIIDRHGLNTTIFDTIMNNKIHWIGYEPAYIHTPIFQPLILPPQARYYWNHRNTADLYPLAGVASGSGITDGDFCWYTSLHYGPTPHLSPGAHCKEELYRFRNEATITGTDDATERHIYLPTFVIGADLVTGQAFAQGAPTNATTARWNVYKYYLSYRQQGAWINIGTINKATYATIGPGNKLHMFVTLTRDQVGSAPTIPANAVLDIQNGGYYE